MNRKTAEKVLAEVKAAFPAYADGSGPNLRDSDHEELSEGSWSIDWEDGPYEWCYEFSSKVPGVFVEPIMSFILGVYDA